MKLIAQILLFTIFTPLTHATPPLFKAYPKIQTLLPYTKLGIYPTPIIRTKKLATHLHIKALYIKDDGVNEIIDKTKYPGDSKSRKLEFLLAHAKMKGYSTVITAESADSNNALQTAYCTQLLGLKSILLLNDQIATSYTKRNLKLDILSDAEMRYFKTDENEILMNKAKLLASINHYYYIPMGGSNERGALGFVNAMFELRKQIHKKEMPEPDVLYVTLCSAGTVAGIIAGAKIAGFTCRIIPVRVSGTPEITTNLLLSLIDKTEHFLHQLDEQIPYQPIPLNIKTYEQQMEYLQTKYNTFIEHNYAETTQETAKAIDIIKQYTNIKLDETYIDKTVAALINNALADKKHRKNVVLFWNT